MGILRAAQNAFKVAKGPIKGNFRKLKHKGISKSVNDSSKDNAFFDKLDRDGFGEKARDERVAKHQSMKDKKKHRALSLELLKIDRAERLDKPRRTRVMNELFDLETK